MINTSGFTVHFYGDPSVGIFSETWRIEGDFCFDSEHDYKTFKSRISEAFEYCCGEATEVMSFEEIEAVEDKLRNGKD